MKRLSISILVGLLLAVSMSPLSASAATKVGTKCNTLGKKVSEDGATLLCKKVGKKLIWQSTGIPNCTASQIYDLKDLVKEHDYLLDVPDLAKAYIKRQQFAYQDALSWGKMSEAAQAQINISQATKEAQVAIGEMAKMEREFKDVTSKCKADGVTMIYRYIE